MARNCSLLFLGSGNISNPINLSAPRDLLIFTILLIQSYSISTASGLLISVGILGKLYSFRSLNKGPKRRLSVASVSKQLLNSIRALVTGTGSSFSSEDFGSDKSFFLMSRRIFACFSVNLKICLCNVKHSDFVPGFLPT